MTTQQPEALRLAGELEQFAYNLAQQSAYELRRLHAESEQHLQELRSYRITVENLEARIAELETELVKEAARTADYKQRYEQINQQHSMLAARYATLPTAQGLDARQWLQQHDFEALERFAETSEDDESYDIGKEAIQRLTHFGCLNSHGFGRYSITAFGSYVLDNWSLARELPFKMQSERDAEYRAAIAALAKQGEQANG